MHTIDPYILNDLGIVAYSNDLGYLYCANCTTETETAFQYHATNTAVHNEICDGCGRNPVDVAADSSGPRRYRGYIITHVGPSYWTARNHNNVRLTSGVSYPQVMKAVDTYLSMPGRGRAAGF